MFEKQRFASFSYSASLVSAARTSLPSFVVLCNDDQAFSCHPKHTLQQFNIEWNDFDLEKHRCVIICWGQLYCIDYALKRTCSLGPQLHHIYRDLYGELKQLRHEQSDFGDGLGSAGLKP